MDKMIQISNSFAHKYIPLKGKQGPKEKKEREAKLDHRVRWVHLALVQKEILVKLAKEEDKVLLDPKDYKALQAKMAILLFKKKQKNLSRNLSYKSPKFKPNLIKTNSKPSL
jgi:hypothetical protein